MLLLLLFTFFFAVDVQYVWIKAANQKYHQSVGF
jgi:hypothetical protein